MIFGMHAPYEDWMKATVKPVGKFGKGDIKVTVIEP
jgi:hypothetical protein